MAKKKSKSVGKAELSLNLSLKKTRIFGVARKEHSPWNKSHRCIHCTFIQSSLNKNKQKKHRQKSCGQNL